MHISSIQFKILELLHSLHSHRNELRLCNQMSSAASQESNIETNVDLLQLQAAL